MTFASRFLGQALSLPPVARRDIALPRDLRVRLRAHKLVATFARPQRTVLVLLRLLVLPRHQ